MKRRERTGNIKEKKGKGMEKKEKSKFGSPATLLLRSSRFSLLPGNSASSLTPTPRELCFFAPADEFCSPATLLLCSSRLILLPGYSASSLQPINSAPRELCFFAQADSPETLLLRSSRLTLLLGNFASPRKPIHSAPRGLCFFAADFSNMVVSNCLYTSAWAAYIT